MTIWALSALINAVTSFLLGLFVLVKNVKNSVYRTYVLFCLSLFVWSIFYYIWQISKSADEALFWSRTLMASAVFIPICYLHHIYALIGELKKYKIRIVISYCFGLTASYSCFQNNFISGVSKKLFFPYWPTAGELFFPFLLFWFLFVFLGIFTLVRQFFRSGSELQKQQLKYVLIATIIGWTGGATNFPLWFNIPVPPIGNILASVYVSIVAYAIVRYRLMDIRLALSNTGIFIGVYALVLGIPIWIGYKFAGHVSWLFLVLLMGGLASAGPFVFFYFQRKAEDKLLQEEQRIQDLLKKASIGMTTIRDLQRLLKLVIDILVKSLRLNHTAIYLLESNHGGYVLKASEQRNVDAVVLHEEDILIQRLKEKKRPIIYEEIKFSQDNPKNGDTGAAEIAAQMQKISASVVVPVMVEDVLLGFIVLGERKEKDIYSPDLIDVLSIVGNQVALAIENAIFYEETGKDLAERFHDSRLKSLGTLGSGIAHQMHNRFNVITFGGGVLLDTLKNLDVRKLAPEELEKIMNLVVKNVEKMVGSAFRGAEITDAIKNYARKADAVASVVLFKAVVKNSMELLYIKQHSFKFKFIEDYPENIFLWVNFSSLQEVIFNAVDNGCDAMALKKSFVSQGELAIKDYDPQIVISGKIDNRKFVFEIEDNGMGFEEEQLKKGVDVPFFTTKGAGKGTGMGIHMMAHYVKQNSGDLRIESEHTQYTKIIITLPLATEDQIAEARLKEEGHNNGNSPA